MLERFLGKQETSRPEEVFHENHQTCSGPVSEQLLLLVLKSVPRVKTCKSLVI